MLTESELTAEIRAGLEAVTPPAPWLVGNVQKRLRASRRQGRMNRTAPALRLGLNVIALIVLITLAATAVGVFVALHRTQINVGPGSGPGIFPTKMISPTTGWALVGQSELWRTTDGGATWTDVSPPHLADRVVDADLSYFLDGKHAWITELGGGRAVGPGRYWVTFRTVDGGRTWRQGDSLADPFAIGSARQFYIDANTGWLWFSDSTPSNTAWPVLYGTRDGGMHWSLITSKAGAAALSGTLTHCGDAAMTFLSAATGWMSLGLCIPDAGFRDILLVTHDGGVTWQVQALPFVAPTGTSIGPPIFFDPRHGIALVFGPRPTLLATSDGGDTWSVRSLPGESQTDVDFVDANHGWAVAGPSSMFVKNKDNSQRTISLPLYHTDDGGVTWTPVRTNLLVEQPTGVAYSNFYFVDQKTGFGTLFTLALGPSEFVKTTDGGRTWNVVRACEPGLGWSSNPPPACPSSTP